MVPGFALSCFSISSGGFSYRVLRVKARSNPFQHISADTFPYKFLIFVYVTSRGYDFAFCLPFCVPKGERWTCSKCFFPLFLGHVRVPCCPQVGGQSLHRVNACIKWSKRLFLSSLLQFHGKGNSWDVKKSLCWTATEEKRNCSRARQRHNFFGTAKKRRETDFDCVPPF